VVVILEVDNHSQRYRNCMFLEHEWESVLKLVLVLEQWKQDSEDVPPM